MKLARPSVVWSHALAFALVLSTSGVAHAETKATTGATAENADPKKVELAKTQVANAETLYADGKYEEALALFEQAHANLTGHPARATVLFNVAKCNENLGRSEEALAAYKSYGESLAADAPDKATTDQKIAELSAAVEAKKQSDRAPEVDPYGEAKERVARAEKLYDDGNYDAALTEFQRAYETMVGHPARSYVLFNVGKCQEKLYLYDDAIGAYRKYLEDAPEDAEDRPAVEAKIELLEGLLGTLRVSVTSSKGPPPASYQVWVDGRLIGDGETKFSLPGGNHEVEIRAEGYEIQNQEVQLPSRAEKSLSFDLLPLAKEYKGLPPVYFWTASGVGAAAALAGGAFGIMTVSKRSSIDNKLPPQVTEDDKKSLEGRALTADLFFIGAGVFATAAVILAINTNWSGGDDAEEEGPVRVKTIGVTPASDGAALSVSGTF